MGAEKWLDIELWNATQHCVKVLKSRGYRIATTHVGIDAVLVDSNLVNVFLSCVFTLLAKQWINSCYFDYEPLFRMPAGFHLRYGLVVPNSNSSW